MYAIPILYLSITGQVSTFVTGLNTPTGIVMNHKEKTFFVADWGSHTIFKISLTGLLKIFPLIKFITDLS